MTPKFSMVINYNNTGPKSLPSVFSVNNRAIIGKSILDQEIMDTRWTHQQKQEVVGTITSRCPIYVRLWIFLCNLLLSYCLFLKTLDDYATLFISKY